MSAVYDYRVGLGHTLRTHARILGALMIRDVSTRFFGNALGFGLAIAWPLSHIFIMIAINTVAGRATPFGDNAALFFATGLLPFMAFNYMGRFTMLGVALNRPLLGYPVVKVTDILLARALVEVLNAGVVVIAAMIILTAMGVDVIPPRPIDAMNALGACMLLGFGFGVVNGIIAALAPFWVTAYGLTQIVMWIMSGVMFVPDQLPETAQYWLSFNPVLIGVEWERSAFYDGYGEHIVDKPYMISFALVSLLVGLLLERLTRGRILD